MESISGSGVALGKSYARTLRLREVTKTKPWGRKEARWDFRVVREMFFHAWMIWRSRYFLRERCVPLGLDTQVLSNQIHPGCERVQHT
jgi:hypothetical protein